jgi:hypothetical protein
MERSAELRPRPSEGAVSVPEPLPPSGGHGRDQSLLEAASEAEQGDQLVLGLRPPRRAATHRAICRPARRGADRRYAHEARASSSLAPPKHASRRPLDHLRTDSPKLLVRRELVASPAAGENQHAKVVLVPFPCVEHVDAGAALAAKCRQRSLALRVVVIERAQASRLPANPVLVLTASDGCVRRRETEPPRIHFG